MDFTIVVGLLAAIGLICFGITDGGIISGFIDPVGIAITFGGTIAAMVIAFPIATFIKVPRQIKIMLQNKKYNPQEYIATIIDFAIEARKSGLLALEEKASYESDTFLQYGMMLLAGETDPAEAENMLQNEMTCLEYRHSLGWHFYEKAASFAVAFGIIGTLIGLINMLANLDMYFEQTSELLGHGISVALVATFYGILLANLVLLPIANKLCMCHEEEMVCKKIVAEGVMAIQSGENPRHIEKRLSAFLSEKDKLMPFSRSLL